MMHAEFNSVVLFNVLYLRFQHCAKDVSKVTVQRTTLEYVIHGTYGRVLPGKAEIFLALSRFSGKNASVCITGLCPSTIASPTAQPSSLPRDWQICLGRYRDFFI